MDNSVFASMTLNLTLQLVLRDPFGITPLYYGYDGDNNLYIASEMKSLYNCKTVHVVPPGHYIYKGPTTKSKDIVPLEYFSKTTSGNWINQGYTDMNGSVNTGESGESGEQNIYELVRKSLTKAVEKRLMSDVSFGVLLSGGLDSSIIASITNRLMKERDPNFKLTTFSIGLEGSPDLDAAQKAADYLGSNHHAFTFTLQEGIDAINDDIYHLETFDVTTIRASVPMFLLSRKIKALGYKMVLSGEGSDEVLGGYLYFHNAPSDREHQLECKRRVTNLGYFDCLRANKSTMAWGLEARVPFLDKDFVNLCINLPKDIKGTLLNTEDKKIEKHIVTERHLMLEMKMVYHNICQMKFLETKRTI